MENDNGVDDEFEYEEEMDAPDALATLGDSVSSFSREDLINAHQLRTSDFRNVALKIIKDTNASMELKQALGQWVHSHFTTEVILANNDPRRQSMFQSVNPFELSKARAELQLDITYLSADKYDSLQPWYISLQDDLMFVFEHFLSRSQGKDRERLLTGKMVSSTEVKQLTGTIKSSDEPKKKKRKFI